jgi:hypothetical protein
MKRWTTLLLGVVAGGVVGAGASELVRRSSETRAEARFAETDAEAVEDRHLRLLAQHRSEARDDEWAAEYETTIRESLQAAASERGFRFINVDCRRTMCEATVEFSSCEEARRLWQGVLFSHGRQSRVCGLSAAINRTGFDEASPSDGPLGCSRVTIVYTCRRDGDAG